MFNSENLLKFSTRLSLLFPLCTNCFFPWRDFYLFCIFVVFTFMGFYLLPHYFCKSKVHVHLLIPCHDYVLANPFLQILEYFIFEKWKIRHLTIHGISKRSIKQYNICCNVIFISCRMDPRRI